MCICMSEESYSQSLFASCLSGHRQICLLRQKGFVIFCSYWIIFHKLASKKYLLDCLGARWPNFRARWDLFVEWSPLMSSLSSLFSTSFRTLLLGTSCRCPCGFVAPETICDLAWKQLQFVMELVDVTFVYTSEMFLKMANCIFFASVQSKSPLEPNRGLGASLSWEKVLRFFNFIWAPFGPILFERWFSQRGRWYVIEEHPPLVQRFTDQDAEEQLKIDMVDVR